MFPIVFHRYKIKKQSIRSSQRDDHSQHDTPHRADSSDRRDIHNECDSLDQQNSHSQQWRQMMIVTKLCSASKMKEG